MSEQRALVPREGHRGVAAQVSERGEAWRAYQETARTDKHPAAAPEVQEASRRRYDAAVRAEEAREGLSGIAGTAERVRRRDSDRCYGPTGSEFRQVSGLRNGAIPPRRSNRRQ